MRLFLSSFRLGRQPEQLAHLVKENRRAAIILNACDTLTETDRQLRLQQEMTALTELGLTPVELDLRHYFNKTEELAALLPAFGLIWVRGGNSFVLRRAMRTSGFDTLLPDLLRHDALAYGGYSAGAVVLTPSLRGVELVDDVEACPAGYAPEPVWEGLNLVPYALAPHYRSEHPESAAVEQLVQYYIDHHISFKALRDGEVILIDGEQETVLS
ncbi:dipeptidase E [Thermosporothrix hazakensis]|jgi:dipeptidase E|uniref:Dipeptidase E n=1 Tax=Thermosporothrix hazakensis TaxID=644383 RepID=A0A326UAY8_THEHA|nr:Type 1 glutamine amidotransferase-like domain-containing protein [Thermosporothrix hazakensis]PZW34371.1 dipeptidase E [Thermosporothrix hazakensis]GCE46080.1 hypothetical protein KTH_09490 [Thermosporothrix hazakensis]